jgi:copper(I)-binding protein
MTASKLRRLLIVVFLLAGIGAFAEDQSISVIEPWIRAAPPGAMVNAGYMTLRNTGQNEYIIEKVTSPDFVMIEMHRTEVKNGLARMLPQDRLVVPAGGELTLRPGGLHLMMMQPKRELRAGDAVKLSLHGKGAHIIVTEAPVRK